MSLLGVFIEGKTIMIRFKIFFFDFSNLFLMLLLTAPQSPIWENRRLRGPFVLVQKIGQPPCFDTRRLTSKLLRNFDYISCFMAVIPGLVPIKSASDSLQCKSTPHKVELRKLIIFIFETLIENLSNAIAKLLGAIQEGDGAKTFHQF